MKNIILPICAGVIALLVASCGVDYPKVDKANAKKACSCYKDVAKLAAKQIKFKNENYEKIVAGDDVTDMEAFENTAEYKEWNEMAKELGDLEEKAKKVCIEDWQKEKGKAYEAMGAELPGLADEFCPEVNYLVEEAEIIEPQED